MEKLETFFFITYCTKNQVEQKHCLWNFKPMGLQTSPHYKESFETPLNDNDYVRVAERKIYASYFPGKRKQ